LLASRRPILLFGGAAALQIPSIALAAFDFFRSEYSATKAELQAALAQRFPLRQRYAELFTVTLRNPQLGLDPENNRLSVTALLAITSPLLQPPGVGGLVSVSSALRYDAPARTLRLDQPRADRIEIEGLSGRWRAAAADWGCGGAGAHARPGAPHLRGEGPDRGQQGLRDR
jgi:hypothetical protein